MRKPIVAVVFLCTFAVSLAQAETYPIGTLTLQSNTSFAGIVFPWRDTIGPPSPPNFSIPISGTVQQVPLLNVPGKLKHVSFGMDSFVYGSINTFYDAEPDTFNGQVENPWHLHGFFHLDGRYRMVSNGATVLSTDFSLFFSADCTGVAPGSCTFEHPVPSFNGPASTFGYFYSTSGGEQDVDSLPIVYSVIEDLRLVGDASTHTGSIRGAVISGDLSFLTDFYIFANYTPTALTPLPAAGGLLLTAVLILAGMGAVGARYKGADSRL